MSSELALPVGVRRRVNGCTDLILEQGRETACMRPRADYGERHKPLDMWAQGQAAVVMNDTNFREGPASTRYHADSVQSVPANCRCVYLCSSEESAPQ